MTLKPVRTFYLYKDLCGLLSVILVDGLFKYIIDLYTHICIFIFSFPRQYLTFDRAVMFNFINNQR